MQMKEVAVVVVVVVELEVMGLLEMSGRQRESDDDSIGPTEIERKQGSRGWG